MEKNILVLYKIAIALFLISQYEAILRQNNFLAMASYILILILLCIDFASYTYKIVFKKK